MMANPDPTPIIVKTYASNSAIGYVVVQMVNGEERVVDTDIKSLTQQQRSLSAFQLEVRTKQCYVATKFYSHHIKMLIIRDF